VLEGVVADSDTRYQRASRRRLINNVPEWSGKSYRELKVLAQDRNRRPTWKRLSWGFSVSAAELL